MNDYYVYALRDPRRNNQPFYVGKGKGNRCYSHLNETYQTTENRRKWCRIESIRRAGFEVVVEKIKEGLTEEGAYYVESILIQIWGRKGFDRDGILTNICEDQRPPSPLGRPVSDETRKKIGDPQRGELNHRFGVAWSDEEKACRSEWAKENGVRPPDRTGETQTAETKARISASMKGKKKSDEHRKALSEAVSGEKHRNWGKKLDDELKAKIRAATAAADSPIKKADWDTVREIRLMHRMGIKAKVIHQRFDHLSLATIRDIINERTWKEEFRPKPQK